MSLVFVLVTVALCTLLATTYLSSQGTATGIARNLQDASAARFLAESGLELTVGYIRHNSTWRTQHTSGVWTADWPVAGGLITVAGEDGVDTDGDGIVDGDGDLLDDQTDRLTITVSAACGASFHVARAVITPIPGTGLKVLMLVPDPDGLGDADVQRKALMESWSWEVTLVDEGISQGALAGLIEDADVVYLPDGLSLTAGDGELNWPIGVVLEGGAQCAPVGISSRSQRGGISSVSIIDDGHDITEEFGTGTLEVFARTQNITHPAGTLADGATVLAERNGRKPAVVVIDDGGGLHGLSAPGLNAFYYTLGFSPSSLDQIEWDAEPTATGIVDNINHAGSSAPGWPGGPNDNFAVRLAGAIDIPQEGTWTFATRSDDGSELWIDGTRVVDNDGLHSMATRRGTISLTAGGHSIEVRAFERGGAYGLIAYWTSPLGGGESIIPASAFSHGAANGPRVFCPFGGVLADQLLEDGRALFRKCMEWAARPSGNFGLIANYFAEGGGLYSLGDVDWARQPDATGTVSNIDFIMGSRPGWSSGPANDFGVEFEGHIEIPESGTWTFYTRSDDGSGLWIDDVQVVFNDGLHSMVTRSGDIDLTAEAHDIRVRVFEHTGDYGIIAYWRGPGVPGQTVIPTTAFTLPETGAVSGAYDVRWVKMD
ncbi:MAG: PA14 domain-containing protein [bacterium]